MRAVCFHNSHPAFEVFVDRLWNYNPYNNNVSGDFWNGENFSFFSQSSLKETSQKDPHDTLQANASLDNGGRILRSVVRPYPAKTAGIPIRFHYELNTGTFEFDWMTPIDVSVIGAAASELQSPTIVPPVIGVPHALKSTQTEVFVPTLLTRGRNLVIEGLGDGDSHVYDKDTQTLRIVTKNNSQGKLHSVVVRLEPPLKPLFMVNDFYSDYGRYISIFFCFVVALLAIRISN